MSKDPGTINLEQNSNSSATAQQTTSQTDTTQIDREDIKRAASLLIDAEYTVDEAIQSFVKRGYSEDKATLIVAYATEVSKTVTKKKSGNGVANLVIGIVLLVAGIALSTAGIGYVFYGAIVVGAVKIVQGIIAMNE